MNRLLTTGGTATEQQQAKFSAIDACVVQYYRCPERYIHFDVKGELSDESGYFHFGNNGMCYGHLSGNRPAITPSGNLTNAMNHAVTEHGTTYLPFDAAQVVNNLRCELYAQSLYHGNTILDSVLHQTYYFLRPLLPVAVRKYLQKGWLKNWNTLKFPSWPVDCTVDSLFEQLLLLSLRSQGVERIPFIWFWPDGAPNCAIMTHDVETKLGRDFCATVMDLDDAYGIKASISIVPELRYEVTTEYLDSIWKRDFEVCVQDLNHDGHLFKDREEYLVRVEKINAYGKQF